MRKYLAAVTTYYRGKDNLVTQQITSDNWDIIEGFIMSVVLSNEILHKRVNMETRSITIHNRQKNKISHPDPEYILKKAKKKFGIDINYYKNLFNEDED